MRRRAFLGLGLGLGGAVLLGGRSSRAATVDPEEASLDELQAAMRSGALSARGLSQWYLERIERLDRNGPALHAVIETNPDALAIAAALDDERRSGHVRGPLHGVPILLKDNIGTHDRNTTTCGSLALAGSIPPRDSTVAARLRAAGAVLLGKSNLSEWANIRSPHSTSGWSARGGQCKNPYALDRNPCGSSSGSGVAVSANLCAAAIGSETDGSIVCPSTVNGIVGLKPTVGLVGRTGIIPISHTQDTAGPMGRSVRDVALVLGALAGADPDDPATHGVPAGVDFAHFLDRRALKGARLGVWRKAAGFDPHVDALFNAALDVLRHEGATLVDPADIPHADDYGEAELEVLLYELKADLNAYLAGLGPGAPVKSLADVIAFNEAHRAEEMAFFGQEQLEKAQTKGPLTDQAYRDALAKCRRLAGPEGIDAVMTANRLDAIVAPTAGPAWVCDKVNGDHVSGGSSSPAAVAGYPNLQVPAGLIFGLPVGISFIGRAFTEPTLLKLGFAYEQATHWRRRPLFPATI